MVAVEDAEVHTFMMIVIIISLLPEFSGSDHHFK